MPARLHRHRAFTGSGVRRVKYLAVLLTLLCLGVSVGDVVVTQEVRGLQAQYDQRRALISEDANYRQLNNQFIRALANAAAAQGDESISEMLASEGVTFTVEQPPVPLPLPVTTPVEGEADE